jgi:hypothetical protein
MPTDNHTKSKKAYLVSLKHKLKKHLQQQTKSVYPVDRRWLNGFMAAGFHSGIISLTELKLEYMKSHVNAYGERMTEAQEQQLERRLTKLCQMDRNRFHISRVFLPRSRRSSSHLASGSRYTIPLFCKRIRHLS